jgi:hypothetical protein
MEQPFHSLRGRARTRMTRRETLSRLLGVLMLCGGGAGVVGGRAWVADAHPLEGEVLLKCVRSVMERTHHGDEPTQADRLFYSHPRRYFGRYWGADYLVSHRHRIKYFQIPKSGSTAIRSRMSFQFDLPYQRGYKPQGRHYKWRPGGTRARNQVKPAALSGEVRSRFSYHPCSV